ncbi:hypothetical protein BD410DRAFT_47069 [Rickenella mellea]|uniref:Uncharacterized protein n=1 Tax=Rickenella mellea TaxID=50990 RepID=A0A4R5XH24_9AGAM|nr:hypothetical protein BD410DRAFT_47069 [Rickenella mellea]
MANRLPDEILKEILGPALTVSDDEFSCGRTTDSPFAYKSTSSAFVLLVCKQWMRVTTPLLYETVVIRSKAQAQALADAVKYNPHFGAYIRKLRMEGGYGMSPYTVISKSPNIKDIFISLDVYSDDNVNGLCKALPLTNPRRLILTKHTKATNLKLTKLINELMSCITSKWLCLETFESHASRFYMIEGYLEALKGCRSLTHIVLANCTEEFLVMLVEVANLKSIRITCQYAPWVLRHLVAQSPVLKQIVQFDGKVSSDDEWGIPLPPGPSPPPPLAIESKPGFTPLEDAPWPVADSIWSYIFSFATYPYPRVDLLDSDDLASEDFQHDWIDWAGQKTTACNISLVSKSFHTFIQPYLLHVVDLKDRDVASAAMAYRIEA